MIGGSGFLLLNNMFNNEPGLALFYAIAILLTWFAIGKLKKNETAKPAMQPVKLKHNK